MTDVRPPLRCNFCGKDQHQVRRLIAAETANICDACVNKCAGIFAARRRTGIEIGQLRLRAFEVLDGWGSYDADGKWRRWGMDRRQVEAEDLAEWAYGGPLTAPTAEPAVELVQPEAPEMPR